LSLPAALSTASTAITLSTATINGPGTITNSAGQTLTLLGTTIGATSGLINQGTVISHGANTINGPYTAAGGSLLRVENTSGFNAALTVANGFTNNGSIELTSAG